MTYRLINSTNIDIDIHLCVTNSLQQQIATAKVGDSFDDDTVDNKSCKQSQQLLLRKFCAKNGKIVSIIVCFGSGLMEREGNVN